MIHRIIRIVCRTPPTAIFGLIVIFAYLVIAAFAPLIAPYSETAIVGTQYAAPSSAHLLGTDHLGRDMLSRLMFGTRNTIFIAFLATVLLFIIGTSMGLVAAICGGIIDQLFSRFIDVLMSIPILIFGLLLLTVFGTSIPVLVAVIGVLESTRVYRLARALGVDIVLTEYVEAARLRGERIGWILWREILPNSIAPLMAEFGMRFSFVILLISALSFLGLGVQPPSADLGSMVRSNAGLISFGQPTALIPAATIVLLTIAVNFVVDWFLYSISGLENE